MPTLWFRVQEHDALRHRQWKGSVHSSHFHMTIHKQTIASKFFVIIARGLASRRKKGLPSHLWLRVNLLVREQDFLRVAGLTAHEISVTDLVPGKGFARTDRGIFAARANKSAGVHGVTRQQQSH